MKTMDRNIVKESNRLQMQRPGGLYVVVLNLTMNLLVVIMLINVIITEDWKHVIPCLKVIVLMQVPWLLERIFKVEFTVIFKLIVQVFVLSSIILGEVEAFYIKLPFWDNMLHTINGFLCSAIGYMFIDYKYNHGEGKRIKPLHILMVAFCFSMTIGVLWEFYEFGMDNVMNRDMQKDTVIHTIKTMKVNEKERSLTVLKDISKVTVDGYDLEIDGYLDIGLYDTMEDLFVNLIGAISFVIIGFIDIRRGLKCNILKIFRLGTTS
ncbi:MAG TPA: hypothetical protein VHQ24_05610 [Lachnospiraceae bacterium]|nr:hypothetical protein [Lachnospiraceae bacterium]